MMLLLCRARHGLSGLWWGEQSLRVPGGISMLRDDERGKKITKTTTAKRNFIS